MSFAITIAGLLVAIYLTYEHFTGSTTLACPANATFNCASVTTSAQSTFVGIPVALLGLVYFVVMGVLCSPPAWRASGSLWTGIRLLGAVVGLVFVFWLLYAELFLINAFCLWCTAVHILTAALFVVLALSWALRADVE